MFAIIDTLQIACFRLMQMINLIGQADAVEEVDPVKDMTKARAVLALVGLAVLFVGMFLMLWLFSRYMRRMVSGESESFENSPFSRFGYQYFEQLDRDLKKKHSDK